MKWDALKYDKSFGFVSEYGEALLSFLSPQKNERILDLGCGTGALTNKIYQTGGIVTGIDTSAEMIETAKSKYPHIDFKILDARFFSLDMKFDAVFSNAVLHWIPEKEKVIVRIYEHLKTGGRFVAEFGGKGNLHLMRKTLNDVFTERGYINNSGIGFRYNPSVAEYTTELEKHGFSVRLAELYDRPTPLKGDNAIKDWFKMFGANLFLEIDEYEKENILDEVQARLAKDLLKNDI